MNPRTYLLALTCTLIATSTAMARTPVSSTPLLLVPASEATDPLPARAPDGFARAETLRFGYVQEIGGQLYAILGETWTFDHGGGSLEGWYAADLSVNATDYFRRISAADWEGHENAVVAPVLAGNASVWIGAFEDEAQDLCWESGLGYANRWCQRITSPPLTYDGIGDLAIGFTYFNDSELLFDYSKLILRLANGDELALNGEGFSDRIGAGSGATPPTPQIANFQVAGSELQAQPTLQIVFEFTSDGGWSDEDGSYVTDYGPFAVDDVSVSGGASASFDFELDLEGWTPSRCEEIGSFFGLCNVDEQPLPDVCDCSIAGNALCFADGLGQHPDGQHVQAISPPIDRSGLGPSTNVVFADFEIYADMPRANGVFYRPGWKYFPWTCPLTGAEGWSKRVGQDVYLYNNRDEECYRERNVATDWGVPGSADLYSFVFEIYASCDAFLFPPTLCSNVTNRSPLVDNIQIGVTSRQNAPRIAFEPGSYFQDGFGTGFMVSTTNSANADIVYDLHRDNPTPDKLGDSLVVHGPVPTSSTRWEARLWWRIRREGPGQASAPGYNAWKAAVSDGLDMVGASGSFTSGLMDSVQIGTSVLRNLFISEFREDDDDYVGEGTSANEMLLDGMFRPGTQVEYFVSSNYIGNTERFLLPDTSGGNYLEFEILPGYRIVEGVPKYPCVLSVDLNAGSRYWMEHAFNVVLNAAGSGDPIPNPAPWDRYDYNDPSSNWNAPLARSVGGNNGAPLSQLLGYRLLVLSSGSVSDGMETEDFTLFGDWLSGVLCNGNSLTNRQGFVGSGDNLAGLLVSQHPSFLVNYLGTAPRCDAYNIANCGPNPADESVCVRVEAAGSQYGAALDYDLYGNWCPHRFNYDVLVTTSGGIGNRRYVDYDAVPPIATSYAQVVKSVTGINGDNYRSVLHGYAYEHSTARRPGMECVSDSSGIATAIAGELAAALNWIYGGSDEIPEYCENPCFTLGVDEDGAAGGGVAHRLLPNHPNPFNPRTTIRFSIGSTGPVSIEIYDVSGRLVKTLVHRTLTAGAHEVVWDGTDDKGRPLSSGIFWSQLQAGEYRSNRKMVRLD